MAYNAVVHYAPFTMTAFLKAVGILEQTGIVTVGENDDITREGDYIHIPKIDDIAEFQRRALGGSGTRTFTEMGSSLEDGVILHDDIANQYLYAQETRTGASFYPAWASRVGLKWFRRAKLNMYRVAKAAIEAAQTSDGTTASVDALISDVYSPTANNTMTFTRLQDAKAKRGDRAGDLTVVVMHSTCWNNLVKDGIGNYKVDDIAGALVGIGGMSESDVKRYANLQVVQLLALNMIIIVDDDIGSISMTGTTYTYKTKYESLLFGPEAMYLGYQRGLTLFGQDDIDGEAGVRYKMRAEVDYCVHLNGIKWDNSSVSNPTDTQLGTKSNWEEAYSDYKEVKCVKMITNG